MSRLFDPVETQNLVDAQLAENDTRRVPLPQGETIAQITGLKFAGGVSNKTGNAWNRMDVTLEITDPEYLEQYPGGMDVGKIVTNLGIMLDMNNGQIATGPNKNIRLGRLRDAAGVNGKPLSALVGNMIRITVINKPHPDDPEIVLDEVQGFTRV